MLLSAVSVLVVAQSSSEIPEGLMNNPILSIMLYFVDEYISFSVMQFAIYFTVITFACTIPLTFRHSSLLVLRYHCYYFLCYVYTLHTST